MSYIKFDKNELINLEYSLTKELIRSNRAGAYASTTIVHCNTRKYHGLLIVPVEKLDNGKHVLLSNIHETIVQHEKEFNLGINKYPGSFHPLGHKYLRDFHTDPIPTLIYRIGGVILRKETLLASDEDCTIIRYTLLDAHSSTKIKLRPFLAFRNIHSLGKANMYANTQIKYVKHGFVANMYPGYPDLFLQTSKSSEFIAAPDWYFNVEYSEEQLRGYEYQEDLFSPGFFECEIKKGESIVLYAGLTEKKTNTLNKLFEKEFNLRIPRHSFEQCLQSAAQQFFYRRNNKTYITAGFPWFDRWGRDTFISLPGLTLSLNDTKTCKAVLDTMTKELKGALFPNAGLEPDADVNSIDAPLWYFWAIQQYAYYTGNFEEVSKYYSNAMLQILNGYKNGTEYNIKMNEQGLISGGVPGKALTWMDAVVNGIAITPRIGFAVEVNALWYNAICFFIELAEKNDQHFLVVEWKKIANAIQENFSKMFWDEKRGYLADYVNGSYKDFSVRPNMVFAASLPYSPVSDDIKKSMLDIIERELLTPRGLRTLSPKDPNYKGVYCGNQATRDAAYHQGTVWPWLIGHFCEAYLKIHTRNGINIVKQIINGFEPELLMRGIGTISEIFDGNPPHEPKGAVSQAWSVAELLRVNELIKSLEKKKKQDLI